MEGTIYMIRPRDNFEMVYIGSTFMTLKKRYTNHLQNYKKNGCITSKFIFKKYGVQNVIIEFVFSWIVKNRTELRIWEQKYLEYFKNTTTVGKVVNNRDAFIPIEKKKQYQLLRNKKYRKGKKIICDICLKLHSITNISRHKRMVHS